MIPVEHRHWWVLSGPLVGLAHGDLNAANIMIDALDRVKELYLITS